MTLSLMDLKDARHLISPTFSQKKPPTSSVGAGSGFTTVSAMTKELGDVIIIKVSNI